MGYNFIGSGHSMSLSSLPDIFKRSLTLQAKAARQGPSFALHLNVSSPEKYLSSRAGYAPGENAYASLGSGKQRAMSTQQAKQKELVLRDFNVRPRDDDRTNIRVSFRQEAELGASAPLKQKLGVSVANWSHFPYENSRRFNNNTLSLEEADSLTYKLESLTKQAHSLQSVLSDNKKTIDLCRSGIFVLGNDLTDELDEFGTTFEESLKQCYATLSNLRRETNEETKANRIQLEKLKGDIQTCSTFTIQLKTLTSDKFTEYVKTVEMQEDFKGDELLFDFEEISSIRKSSRGATGDISRRTKRAENPKKTNLPQNGQQIRQDTARGRFVLNGKEIDIVNFEDDF